MMRFGWALAALCVWGLPGAGQAQDCNRLMEAFQVPPVTDDPADSLGAGEFGCSQAQMEMFERNMIAVREALPVADPADLYGTWLGDDVLLYLMGVVVPGQEVLRISEGAEPGSLRIEQFWMKVGVPDAIRPVLWDEAGRYAGRVVSGMLMPLPDGVSWRSDPFGEDELVYSNLGLEFERSYDLYVKQAINHFEFRIYPRLMGDVLVLEADRLAQPMRDIARSVVTYSRVDELAPELALQIIIAMEISQAEHFDCLTHQINDGEGPFIDAMQPHDMAEVSDTVGTLLQLGRQREALMQTARDEGGMSDDMQAEFITLMDAWQALEGSPVLDRLNTVLQLDKTSGCSLFP